MNSMAYYLLEQVSGKVCVESNLKLTSCSPHGKRNVTPLKELFEAIPNDKTADLYAISRKINGFTKYH